MSSTDETRPAAKSGRRKKGEARRQKSNATESPAPVEMRTTEPEQSPVPQAEVQPAIGEPLEAVVAEAMVAEEEVIQPAEAASPTEPAAADPAPVSLQTIANAYRDYTRKSFEQFGSFFEQLSGVRTLDKAMEVQTAFVKQAYESSVAESQKIRELHRKLARQTLEPFGNPGGKTPATHGKS